jgi:proteasome alpha subunit
MQIDEHVCAAISGLPSDGRVLVERAQIVAQNHRNTYDEKIDVKSLVKDICNQKQAFTQYGGMRPYGVSLLVAGVDEKPRLFMTEVSGIFFEMKAAAIGRNSRVITNYLNKNYKDELSFDEALKLCVNALKEGLASKFDIEGLKQLLLILKTKNSLLLI